MPIIDDAAIAAAAFAEDPFHRPSAEQALRGGALVSTDRAQATSDDAPLGLEIDPDADLEVLRPLFDRAELIAVRFPSFADGRGFSIARRLRSLGYRGRLRAAGHVIVDQYAFARACGFDEVEIDAASAARQPIALWRAAAAPAGRYQRKVAGVAAESA